MACQYPIHSKNIDDFFSKLTQNTFENEVRYYYPNGSIAQIKHIKDNQLIPLDDKPSIIRYYFSFNSPKDLLLEEFFFKNQRCYLGKQYYQNGNLSCITKFNDQSLIPEHNNRHYHCDNGPAIIYYNKDGTISSTEYFYQINNAEYTKLIGRNLNLSSDPDSVKNYHLNLQLLS